MNFVNAFPDETVRPPRAGRALVAIVFVAAALGGCKKEGRRIQEAYKQTYHYATMFDPKTRRARLRSELPKSVFLAEEVSEGGRGTKLDLGVFVPFGSSPKQVVETLKKVATKAMGFGHYRAVRARAWFEGLYFFGGPVATYVLSKDGAGWDGNASGYRIVSVDFPKLSRNDYEILRAVEAAYLELRKESRRRDSRRLEKQAVSQAAKQLGLTVRNVASIVARARQAFADGEAEGRPRPRRARP